MVKIERHLGPWGVIRKLEGVLKVGEGCQISLGRQQVELELFRNHLLRVRLLGDQPSPVVLEHMSRQGMVSHDRHVLDSRYPSVNTSLRDLVLIPTRRRLWGERLVLTGNPLS